jgi:hypothetical protein
MKMKFIKVVVPLLALLALLVIAMPAAAQAPVCPNWIQATNLWFLPPGCSYPPGVVTGTGRFPAPFVRAAGTYVTPFGGEPLTASKFGDGYEALPGGTTKQESGDGTSANKAIYIGGAWDTVQSVRSDIGERPMEIPGCATVNIPAGTSRWFKADTWKNKKLLAWVDDELATAKAPSGSAVFGAPDLYMQGLSYAHFRAKNYLDNAPTYGPDGNFLEGLVMAVYDPDNMFAEYFFKAPNARIYTVNYSSSGGPARTYPNVYAGHNPLVVHGYAQYNWAQPAHLLWFEGRFDGWVHFRVRNQMIWDQVATVCTYRATTDAPADH